MSILISCYNKTAKQYGPIMEFENKDLAIAKIRRQLRDEYIKGQTTEDSIVESTLHVVGWFDTYSGTVSKSNEQDLELVELIKDLIPGKVKDD